MANRGLLLTMTEPPPAMEEEFNAWYDDEHLPERLAIPGFRSARRWVADLPRGEGRYLATYELDSPGVLTSPEYLARFKGAPTAWTQRCLGKAVVFKRWACEQTAPGTADLHPRARALLVTFENKSYEGRTLQVRKFLASSGEAIALYELADPAPTALFRVYRRYQA